jgi:16S rRNA C1402 N4-methylase RsmH
MSEFSHIPVMLEPVMAYLLTGPGLYVDGTLGGGGHSEQILARCGQPGHCIDRIWRRLRRQARPCAVSDRFCALHGNFAE